MSFTVPIGGMLRSVPITGILLRKLMATGKNPLKRKEKRAISGPDELHVITEQLSYTVVCYRLHHITLITHNTYILPEQDHEAVELHTHPNNGPSQ